MTIYLIYFGIGLLGMALQIVIKMQAQQSLAKKANVVFTPSQYFSDNWLSLISSLLAVILGLVFVSDAEAKYPSISGYTRFLFGFLGYTGSSVFTWLFSLAGNRLTSAIDYKTTIADKATGTLDAPTPATKP